MTNSQGQKIAVLVERSENQAGLAFLMHGFGGFKEQTHIQAMAEALKENGYTVVRFDCRYALGESDGETIEATQTTYDDDLHDVINWIATQPWYQEPFVLGGHSLGGMTVALYAEDHPERVKGVIPFAPVISGDLQWAKFSAAGLKQWQEVGYVETPSSSKQGQVKRMSWRLMEDIKQYDLFRKIDWLTMPVLLIVGERDESIPVKDVQLLYDKIPGSNKRLEIVAGARHTFREPHHLEKLKRIVSIWGSTL